MQLDPRTKLLFIVAFSTVSVLAKDLVCLGATLLVVVTFDLLLKVNLLVALKRLRHLFTLIVFIALMQSLFLKTGKPLVTLGHITLLSTGGLLAGGEFVLRMGIIICTGLVATTAKNREMVDGMIKLKLPYEFAFMVSVALKFLPLLRDEFSARLTALSLRGVDAKKLKLPKKIKMYTYLIAPTVSGTILTSRDLAVAMETRAFRAYTKRTMARTLAFGIADYVVWVVAVALLVGLLYYNYTLGGTLIVI